MRDILEHLLQSVDVPNLERAQLHWDEYRSGAVSPDPAVKAAADAAFATLLAWYGGSLYRHIWGFIRTDAAEDVFQDVLRKLHEKRQSQRLTDFHANVLPWLRTVAIRECVDAHRRTIRRHGREFRAARPEQHPPSDNPGELHEALSVALARLTPKEQQAIALHYFEGHDRQTAAAILGVNRDTLAARLNTALARLQKFVPAPAGILVGGTITAPAALTARPPALTAARLGEIVAAAWDKATEAGWLTGRAAAAAMIGLALCGAAAAAGWALTSESPQPEEVRTLPPPVNEPPESLQARNLRILERDIVPIVLDGLRGLALPNNPWRVDERRAEGSQVWVTFRRTRPLQYDTRDVIRVSYCVLNRRMQVTHFDNWQKRWKGVDLSNPVIQRVAVPFFGNASVTRLRAEMARVLQAFDSLPADDRAEQEQVRYLFGEHGWTGREFTIPSTAWFVSSNSHTLFVWLPELGETYSRRVDGGGWRSAGILPGWQLCVDETHFYRVAAHDSILARRINDPEGPWARVGAVSPRIAPKTFLTAADGKLFLRGSGPTVLTKAAHDPDDPWTELPGVPSSWSGLASAGGRLFSGGGGLVYELPLNQPNAKWRTSGKALPNPHCLAVWGDRLLLFPGNPGPILSRSVSDPEAPWEVMGRLHIPQDRVTSRLHDPGDPGAK